MAPVMAGMCNYSELTDGSLDLADIAEMNEALIVKHENDFRAREAAEKNRPK